MTQLTLEDVKAALPATLQRSATQELTDTLNNLQVDPEVARNIRENFVSYSSVLKDGKFKTEDYLSAVTYVSFKLMGDTNKEAWCKTFPLRYAALVGRGASEKDISAHVSAYARGQMVNKILEQSMVPTWVLNQDAFQKAINTQVELMTTASSEKVRSDAANSILTHLKRPEAVKGQIDLNINDETGMKELKSLLGDVARQQIKSMEQGTPIKQITDAVIIENGNPNDGAN